MKWKKKVSKLFLALLTVFFASVVLFHAPSPAAAQPSFTGLGDLPGGGFLSVATGISGDGAVVVGLSESAAGTFEAFRWIAAAGMVGLGDLPGGIFRSRAFGISGDGAVVVGSSFSGSGEEAIRWTAATGMVGLGDLPGGAFLSEAIDASADGSIIVGVGCIEPPCPFSPVGEGEEAFRWTAATGLVGLGHLPGGIFLRSRAFGVSADGSVVVGESEGPLGREAFRWTAATGMVGLGDLPGGADFSEAFDVSADGSVIVGQSESAAGVEAFRWTAVGGMVGLGDLPGGAFFSQAFGVSGDGSVIVGQSSSASGFEAFIWDAVNGMRSLKDVLVTDLGLDLTGWTLERATAVSADGLTVVGYGTNPSGQTEGWIATLGGPAPFAAFNAKVEIEDHEFEVKATFTLGAGSDGMDIPTEIVSLELTGGTGAFSTTIPAGSFKQDKKGRFKFEGVIDGVKLEAVIRPLAGGAFEFKAEGEGANLTGIANPVTVTLTVGDDGGSTTVEAEFE